MLFERIHNNTFYNPITNHLVTGNCSQKGYYSLGCRKVAEAFTSVTPEERIILWNYYNNETFGIDIRKLNSKLKHKMNKLGINKIYLKDLPKGIILLNKIKNKRK